MPEHRRGSVVALMMMAPPYQGQLQGSPVMVYQPMIQPTWGMQQFAGDDAWWIPTWTTSITTSK